MTCSICFNSFKHPKKLQCSHVFCYNCINKWSKTSDKCPICRINFELNTMHKYNTRSNNFIKHKKEILFNVKNLIDLDTFNILEYEEKLDKFNEILQFIYENKNLLKIKKFKNAVVSKINYLKNKNEFLGYYWSQKIY